jgi:hypothetical protein
VHHGRAPPVPRKFCCQLPADVIAAEPLEAYVKGYVIEQWRNPETIKIAQSDDDRMSRITEIADETRHWGSTSLRSFIRSASFFCSSLRRIFGI